MECEWCCALKPALVCGLCKDAAYCNAQCASEHWSDTHQVECIGQNDQEREQVLVPIGHLFSEYSEGMLPQLAAPSMGTYHTAKLMTRNGMNPLELNSVMDKDLAERRAALKKTTPTGPVALENCINGFISPRLFQLIVREFYDTGGDARRMYKFLKGRDAYLLNWGYSSVVHLGLDRSQLSRNQIQRPVGDRTTDVIIGVLTRVKNKIGVAYRTSLQLPPTASEPVYQLPRGTRVWRAGRKSLDRSFYWFAFDPATAVGYIQPTLLSGPGSIKDRGNTKYYRDHLRPVTPYKVNKRRLIFFNLDDTSGIQSFLFYMKERSAPEEVQEAFKFGWLEGRRSVLQKDTIVAKWICEQGDVDGYISYRADRGPLLPEILICNPKQKLQEDWDAPEVRADIPMIYDQPYKSYELKLM